MYQAKVFEGRDGRDVTVIPPSSPHPSMEIGIAVNADGHLLKIWFSREETRALAAELTKQAGKR